MIQYNDSRNDEAFQAMRPQLFLTQVEETQPIENFQNEVLRPILKMQHNLLVDTLMHQPNFDAVLKYKEKRSVFSERVRIFLQQPILKGMLLGMVLGCFTGEESAVYYKNAREYNKRIHQMLLQRLVDSF